MASNNRIPPLRLRHSIPSPHLMHLNPYAPPIHHHHRPPGNFPPFEIFARPEVMEQKLSAQHVEIQKLATENQRLAATHVTLRQDLTASKHELQLMNIHAAEAMSEKEQQMRSLVDKMSVIEAELKGAEPIKMHLQKAHAEAQGLVGARQDLISKVQQLTNELQKALTEAKQIPELLSELDGMRQEYHHCRATYDYEKKLYSDHLESLQVMEKNYAAMSAEVERLRAELTNSSNFDPRTGMPYGGPGVYNESITAGNYATAQNTYGVGGQHNPYTGGGNNDYANPASGTGIIGSSTQGNSTQVIAQTGPTNSQTAHEAARVSAQASFVAGGYAYDPYGRLVVAGYDSQTQQAIIAQGYNVPMGYSDAYDPQRAQLVYDMQRAAAHEVQTGAYYDAQKTAGYESSSGGTQGQVPVANAVLPYGSGAPGNRAGMGHESLPKSGNQVQK